MPVWDWQFVIVTLIALSAMAIVVRRVLPARKTKAKGADAPPMPAACSHCASAESSKSSQQPQRAARTATVPVVSINDLRGSAHQQRR
jgi:hypothetical protein